jgi:hypothetical protein
MHPLFHPPIHPPHTPTHLDEAVVSTRHQEGPVTTCVRGDTHTNNSRGPGARRRSRARCSISQHAARASHTVAQHTVLLGPLGGLPIRPWGAARPQARPDRQTRLLRLLLCQAGHIQPAELVVEAASLAQREQALFFSQAWPGLQQLRGSSLLSQHPLSHRVHSEHTTQFTLNPPVK